jgi:hypothetical protein
LSETGRSLPQVPELNISVYRIVYAIEVVLRELLIVELGARHGAKWPKSRLPPDVYDKYMESRLRERKIKWTQLTPHHPVYFLDFPDLRKVIERNDNWKEVFAPLFSSKEPLLGLLAGIESVRNVVAHNRKCTAADMKLAVAAREVLACGLGDAHLLDLENRCTVCSDVAQKLSMIRRDLETAIALMLKMEPLVDLPSIDGSRHEWWFEKDYLGHDIADVDSFFDLVNEYRALPRERGTGHRIETWVRKKNIQAAFGSAQDQIDVLLAELSLE